MVKILEGTFSGYPIHYVLPSPNICLDKQRTFTRKKIQGENLQNTFAVHIHSFCFFRKINGAKTKAFSYSQDQISNRSERQTPEKQKE